MTRRLPTEDALPGAGGAAQSSTRAAARAAAHAHETPRSTTADTAVGVRQTRFRDVCGSVDELKRVLYEEPDRAAAEPRVLDALIEDVLYMLARMEQRLEEYEQFRTALLTVARELPQIGESRRAEA